ncbi:cytochrome-c oxidase, cbb3-type subunit II [Geothermobacter hydrogeniphilus]|uniref:Cytochrome-c oxidase, cbb3-type subunit II n=1 Tax=Geothermobacter hydrogeniphilus TaxID=1969733 RepID=A0A1X0YCN8_9BACT|nr:cytochrome-c oxidase, cbb3-type subunit II [Geothermobacter hydrogeniphilus]ORJ62859.1 cytochrome-c oxidase, cbb3-type subunit II [Geothermobacter hydrogeniphilus]
MWERKPVLLLVLATAAIMVGTIVTMILPFAWVNTDADRIATVTPYNPLEQEGRDIYIREGCNNCHTQTIRPLVTEVLRYGDYSKSGEFVYDRPFLWGSKRTGPDLARIGGKYPDAWHYKHMESPRAMVPRSNMPDYGWLKNNLLDPQSIRHKMDVLGFPYKQAEIDALKGKNEMDAIVAYLQKLGTGIPWRKTAETLVVGELHNPYQDDLTVLDAGKALYMQHCAACHGEKLQGEIGPELTDLDMPDADLYQILFNGFPEDGMPPFSAIGSDRLWKMVNFLKNEAKH